MVHVMRKSTILVVDDTPMNLRLLMDILIAEDYEVRLATSGHLALQSIQKELPDLVLLDIKMPEMDGFEVCRRIKLDPAARDLPVIVVSALDDVHEKIRAFSQGAVDYMIKPIQAEEVLVRVKTHLALKEAQQDLRAEVERRRQAEERLQIANRQMKVLLQDQELRFSSIMDNLPILVMILDPDLRVVYVNKQRLPGMDLFLPDGIPLQEICRQIGLNGRETEQVVADSHQSMKQGPLVKELTTVPVNNRQRSTFRTIRFPIRSESGPDLLGVLGIDITELKEAEQALVYHEKMKSLGEMSAGIAHEINNPNNSILLNTEIVRDAWKTILPILDEFHVQDPDFMVSQIPYPEMRGYMESLFTGILEGSRSIRAIVKSLKDYAYPESMVNKEAVRIADVVDSAVLLLNNLIRKSTRHLDVRLDSGLPPVRGNRQHLEQVFINLLQNACLALTDRDQRIEITAIKDSDRKLLTVQIRDEGAGISQEDLKRVQEPFFTRRRNQGGTGLGLFICTKIIEDHQGNLALHSEQGFGTSVRISLPLDEPA